MATLQDLVKEIVFNPYDSSNWQKYFQLCDEILGRGECANIQKHNLIHVYQLSANLCKTLHNNYFKDAPDVENRLSDVFLTALDYACRLAVLNGNTAPMYKYCTQLADVDMMAPYLTILLNRD